MYPGIDVVEKALCWEGDAGLERIREELSTGLVWVSDGEY
jgi:hypothetical protein